MIAVILIVAFIACAVCYENGNKAGYAKRRSEDGDIVACYKSKLEKLKFLDTASIALESFCRSCKKWTAEFGLSRMAGKSSFEKMHSQACEILNAIYTDLQSHKSECSIATFKKTLDTEKMNRDNERIEEEKQLKQREIRLRELQKETLAAKENAEKQLSEARKTATQEILTRVKDVIAAAKQSHPDNKYIADVLSQISDATIRGIIAYINENCRLQAYTTATKTIEAIRKRYNENARQWHHDAVYYKSQSALYESLFPQLLEYSDVDNKPDVAKTSESDWLSKDEYAKLNSTEKSQLALERYTKSEKSHWQIGRDYELFVGHYYRDKGWNVEQFGINKKLEDMGRDLICRKYSNENHCQEILIVQCKYWSSQKIIHEKHIAQLYGTTVEYAIEQGKPYIDENYRMTNLIHPVFVTSSTISATAKRFAKVLNVEIIDNLCFSSTDLLSFPRIKCNQGKYGERIYHLPFDQQYDTTKIDDSKPEECWCYTVADAEAKGYRRAMRWQGEM